MPRCPQTGTRVGPWRGEPKPGKRGGRGAAPAPGAGCPRWGHGPALGMTAVPAASPVPECNGSVSPEKGPLQVISATDEIAKSVRTVPYANAETSPDASPAKENWEENRNSLAEDIIPGDFDGEKQCEGKVQGSLSVRKGRLYFMYSRMNNRCAMCISQKS